MLIALKILVNLSCILKLKKQLSHLFAAEAIDERGALHVNEYFQVKGHENIYAIGDVTALEEEKMGYTATQHVEYLFKTLSGYPTFYPRSKSKNTILFFRNCYEYSKFTIRYRNKFFRFIIRCYKSLIRNRP